MSKSVLSWACTSWIVCLVPTINRSSTWYESAVRFSTCVERQGRVNLTQRQLSSRCSPNVLANASARSVDAFLQLAHDRSRGAVQSLRDSHKRKLGVNNVPVLHVCVEEKTGFTSAVNTVYCAFLRSMANATSIRTDAVSVVLATTSSSFTSSSTPRNKHRAFDVTPPSSLAPICHSSLCDRRRLRTLRRTLSSPTDS